jgi:hypothetical protein
MAPTNDSALESRADAPEDAESVQVWMVERTYSQDSPHILVVRYATADGAAYFQQERAVPSYSRAAVPEVTAATEVPSDRLAPVEDAETRERYAAEAERMRETHDPDDVV